MKKFRFPAVALMFFYAFITLSLAARQPLVIGDNNEWGTVLNKYLNVSFDVNGTFKNQTFNVTGSNVFLADTNNLVGIGTISPLSKLHVQDSSAAGAFLIANASGTTIFYVNGSSGRIAIGNTTNPADILTVIGSVSVFGPFNATFINATEIRQGNNLVQTVESAFTLTNYSAEYANTGYKLVNFTSHYATEYSSTGYKKGNLSADLSAGVASSILTTTLTSDNIIVNKNLYIIGNISNTNIINLNINGSLYPALDDFFDLGDKTFRWRNANFSGNLQALAFIGDGSKLANMPYSNFRLENVSNTTSRSRILDDNTIQTVGTFDLRNISNYTQYTRSSDFNLGNVSNDTLHSADNLSMKVYVDTFNKSVDLHLYNQSVDLSGYSKSSFVNGSDINVTLLNVVKINGTSLDLFNKSVDLSGYLKILDASVFNLLNLTKYFGDAGFNGSVLRVTNSSFFSQFTRSADFNLGNISNYTTDSAFNDSTSLVNKTGLTKLYFKYLQAFFGFGTANPSETLTGIGNFSWQGNMTFRTANGQSVFNFSGNDGRIDSNATINAPNITAIRFTGKLNCGMIDGGSDGDYCTDATGGGGDLSAFTLANWSLGFGTGGNASWQREATAFNLANNFTAQVPLCSGTDKLTSSDGNTLTCATDQTGAGSSSKVPREITMWRSDVGATGIAAQGLNLPLAQTLLDATFNGTCRVLDFSNDIGSELACEVEQRTVVAAAAGSVINVSIRDLNNITNSAPKLCERRSSGVLVGNFLNMSDGTIPKDRLLWFNKPSWFNLNKTVCVFTAGGDGAGDFVFPRVILWHR